jgi:hypothetical protein
MFCPFASTQAIASCEFVTLFPCDFAESRNKFLIVLKILSMKSWQVGTLIAFASGLDIATEQSVYQHTICGDCDAKLA